MNIGDLPHVAIFLVIAGIALSIGAYVTTSVQNQMTAGSTAALAAANATAAIGTLSQWQSTIAIVVAAAVIIGVVLGSLMLKRG